MSEPSPPIRIEDEPGSDAGWVILDRDGKVVEPQELVDLINNLVDNRN